MRSNLKIRLFCSKCQGEIESELFSDKEKSVEYSSAYEITWNLLIDPCRYCYHEEGELKRVLKKALTDNG